MTTCPECMSFRIKKYGWRKNKRGLFQKYKCKSCGKQFIDDDFLWMQTPKEVVAFAIRLWRRGLRPSWIVQEIRIVYRIERSVYALFYWIKKFLDLFKFINNIPLVGISERLHWDYTYIKISGKDAYLWVLKDSLKKFVVGWIITTTKTLKDAKASLFAAKKHFLPNYQLKEIVSDGEQSFPRAIWEVFNHAVKHYRYKGFRDKKNNNLIEELWRLKNHIPEFRTIEQAERFFTIWVAFYNVEKSLQARKIEMISNLEKITIFQPIFTIQVL